MIYKSSPVGKRLWFWFTGFWIWRHQVCLRAFTQNRYISGNAHSGFDFMLDFSVFLKFYFMCIFVLPPGVDNDHKLLQCLWSSEEGVQLSGNGVPNSYEPQCGFWEPNPYPLQEQQMILTAEPCLQSPNRLFFFFCIRKYFIVSKCPGHYHCKWANIKLGVWFVEMCGHILILVN